ncbi:unnamed protein product [Vitrella brassicaformis CCMP3155]|uniref:Uncharacterized protein n=3 Tax=Vitrella brassicaformis TaxID=1169539 RepID=A0A0G4FNB1_VITBC|nr:unnamed protein product [Vitrella brassicaformis CCMP3155]|eukprot:CEM15729.1 unnamed protein product [Vitrella brassicaformis CCMP3155]
MGYSGFSQPRLPKKAIEGPALGKSESRQTLSRQCGVCRSLRISSFTISTHLLLLSCDPLFRHRPVMAGLLSPSDARTCAIPSVTDVDDRETLQNIVDDISRSMDSEREQFNKRIEELETQRDAYKKERDDYKKEGDEHRKERDEWMQRAQQAEAELDVARERLQAKGAAEQEAESVDRTIMYEGSVYYGSICKVGGTEMPHGWGILWLLDGERKRYEREWKGGKRHAKGIEYASDGQMVYEGDFVDGKRHGHGEEFTNGEVTYTGVWVRGEKKGAGVATGMRWEKDGYFVGPTLDGKPHGQGELRDRRDNNVIYSGDWRNGKRHGHGKELTGGRVTYEGVWVNGEKKGAGVATGMWWEGHFYHGPTLDGRPHGEGELRDHHDNVIFKGQWTNGRGHGEEFDTQGRVKYEGQWEHGKRHGRGKALDDGGMATYEGEWADGKRHGQGKAYYQYDGPVLWFEGEWRDNQIVKGTLFPNGTCRGQMFPDGTPVWPMTPIPWETGEEIPDAKVGGCKVKLHAFLETLLIPRCWVDRYLPEGALPQTAASGRETASAKTAASGRETASAICCIS